MVFVFSLRGGPIQEPKFRISRGGVYTLRMAGYLQRASRISNCLLHRRGGYILFAWPDISSVLPGLPGLPGLQGLPELRARVGWIFEWHGACGGPADFPNLASNGPPGAHFLNTCVGGDWPESWRPAAGQEHPAGPRCIPRPLQGITLL